VTKRGDAIIYALTIPRNATKPQDAIEYIQFLLGPGGRKALDRQYMKLLEQPWTHDLQNLPAPLRSNVIQRRAPSSVPG